MQHYYCYFLVLGETSGVNDKQKRESDGLNAEQELARKLLRKCSNFKGLTFSSGNKKINLFKIYIWIYNI